MSLSKPWRVDYRNDTTAMTLYETETSDVLIWFPYHLVKPLQMRDFAYFFVITTKHLLFRISFHLLISVGEEYVLLGLCKPIVNFIADSLWLCDLLAYNLQGLI